MKTVVFAYHDMGLAGLDALKRASFEIAAIFSHEDDPEENCWFGSVVAWAGENDIPVFCPEEINTAHWIKKIADLRPEVIFSFYYRRLLAPRILAIPPRGAFNLHGSFLPRYRGRCPVNWVLVNGETVTGVTLHDMVENADAGDIVAQRAVPIDFADTARTLYRKLCRQATVLLDEALPLIKAGAITKRAQDLTAGSYYGGRRPEDGRIGWRQPATVIYNLIRAVTEPYPGAFTENAGGDRVTIWWALPEETRYPAGSPGGLTVEGDAVYVSAGEGRLRLIDIEINGVRLKDRAILNYFRGRERGMWL